MISLFGDVLDLSPIGRAFKQRTWCLEQSYIDRMQSLNIYLPFRRLIFLAFLFLKTLQFLRKFFLWKLSNPVLTIFGNTWPERYRGQEDCLHVSHYWSGYRVKNGSAVRYDLMPHWKTIAFPTNFHFINHIKMSSFFKLCLKAKISCRQFKFAWAACSCTLSVTGDTCCTVTLHPFRLKQGNWPYCLIRRKKSTVNKIHDRKPNIWKKTRKTFTCNTCLK